MKLIRDVVAPLGLVGAGLLIYGCVVESNQLVVERKTLALPGWPERLRGYKIAVLADLHLRPSPWSIRLAKNAVAAALDEAPDFVVLAGDVVAMWKPEIPAIVGDILEPLLLMEGNAAAVPGNHEYEFGNPEILHMILHELNVRLLRNESWKHDGITWVGVDSAVARMDDANEAMKDVSGPAICLWHEPDMVDRLPHGCQLMISGHSHGGQFRFGSFAPMYTRLGKRYPLGYYDETPTPLYVSRGIGTTGPPSRFMCPPEVSILTLVPG